MQADEIAARTAALMPGLIEDLEKLVAIPSVAFPGYPPEPVERMAEETLRMFRAAGFTDARLMEVLTGYPPIYGEVPGPEGSPVVVLYAHYDVQPAPPEQGWTSDPWTATRKDDGRIYGRGAADDIGGLVTHLGTMAPGAEFVLWGPEDVAAARIHSSDESVDPREIESMVVAQALLLQRLGGAG
ncbi:M20/M25/M40 family metallo-hydrolase [Actinoplanes sp. NPDC049118]|uniref:M20/M25/M40 family metallo-hydrolase n=1 Tax=Actinoplanes sp. NPDC049118 TaxID=3155769 RepID=UPI0033D13C8B